MHNRSIESKQPTNEIAQAAPVSEPSVSKDFLLQKFKNQTEELPPSLDEALRRAAVQGTIQDVEYLLRYGAKISSQDAEQNTALHLAVKNSKPEMTAYLLKRHASRNLRDVHGKVAGSYCKDEDLAIKKLFADATTPSLFKNNNILSVMFSFLENEEISRAARVRFNWHSLREKSIKASFDQYGLGRYYELFQGLSPLIKKIIAKQLREKNKIKVVKKLLQVLTLNGATRLAYIISPRYFLLCNPDMYRHLYSDIGVTLFFLKYITTEFFPYRNILCTKYGAIILSTNLLTIKNLSKLKEKCPDEGNFEHVLKRIFCKNGLMALSRGILKPEDFIHTQDLPALLSKSNEMQNAVLVFQKHWRGKTARRKHALFREQRVDMSTTGDQNVDQLQQVKKIN